jgi:hypothetical protein
MELKGKPACASLVSQLKAGAVLRAGPKALYEEAQNLVDELSEQLLEGFTRAGRFRGRHTKHAFAFGTDSYGRACGGCLAQHCSHAARCVGRSRCSSVSLRRADCRHAVKGLDRAGALETGIRRLKAAHRC